MAPAKKRRKVTVKHTTKKTASASSSVNTPMDMYTPMDIVTPSTPALHPLVAKEMTEWQEDMNTVEQRDMFILQNDMFTDCTFAVGPARDNAEIVKCHRMYLAKTSPVFFAMMYGNMQHKEDGVIHLPDVSLPAFKAMLKYIYSGKLKLSEYSYETVFDILYLAKKYLLPKRLRSQLRAYLWQNIPDHVWTVIQLADTNDEPELLKTAWQVVISRPIQTMNLPSFVRIPMSVLQTLVSQETLSCSEAKLFKACVTWAKAQTSDSENLRQVLEPILPHIRFLAMTKEDLANFVLDSNILTKVELFPFLAYGINNKIKDLPHQFCSLAEKRDNYNLEDFFVFGIPDESFETLSYADLMKTSSSVLTFASIKKEFRKLFGIQVPSQIKKDLPVDNNETYEEHLHAYIINPDTKEILDVAKFRSYVPYNSILNIPCTKSIEMGAPENARINVHVLFFQTGKYHAKRQMDPLSSKYTVDNFEDHKNAVIRTRECFNYIHSLVYSLKSTHF